MQRFRKVLGPANVLGGLALATPSHAGIFRAYLSLNGSDANPCTLPAPCRLLPAALAAVNDGGEIWMLDSANFNAGPVTIDKAVTILAIPGALGSVVASGPVGLTVATTGAVTLRNLNILPLPGSESGAGISVTQAGTVTVQDSNITGFNNMGAGLTVTAAARATVLNSVLRGNATAALVSAGARLSLMDSTILDSDTAIAVNAFFPDETAHVALTRSKVRGGTNGIVAAASSGNGQVNVDIAESRFEDVSSVAVSVSALLTTTARLMLARSVITRSGTGVTLNGAAGARGYFTGNAISGNTLGVNISALTTGNSDGTNLIRGNGTDVQGSLPTAAGQ